MIRIMYFDYEIGQAFLQDGRLQCTGCAGPLIERYRYRFDSDRELLLQLPRLLRGNRVWAKIVSGTTI